MQLFIGQENMLNVPFVEIISTGFITDPFPNNRLLRIVALSVSVRPVSGGNNCFSLQEFITIDYETCGSE